MHPVPPRLACYVPIVSFLILCCLPGNLRAQTFEPDAYNTTFFDAIDPRPPVPPLERYSALWGYTAPDGREYALLGGYTGTHIIDITEKPIKEVAFVPGPHSQWREMKTYGIYAYVVNETGEGLQIIDLSDLPNSASVVRSDSSAFRRGHTIVQEGVFLYVNGVDVEAGVNQGTLIFNLENDPLNPELVGMYAERYVHDVTVRNDTMYAAAIENGQMDIVYLGQDRATPQFVTDIRYPEAGTHSSDLTTDGRYLLTADEIGGLPRSMRVWDLSDRQDIRLVTNWTPVPLDIIHNIHVVGNLAYISWYTAGTRIVDISDPAKPVVIAYFDAHLSGEIFAFAGNWEIYPYFRSGKLIASYMSSGLHVFTLDVTTKGTVRGVVRDAVTNAPLPGAIIRSPKVYGYVTADDQGRYEIAGGAGSLAFSATALNYRLNEGELTLTEDGAEQDILMTPLELRTLQLIPVDRITEEPLSSFSYNILTRGEGTKTGEPATLSLPTDSAYTIMVGAWGHIPTEVVLQPGEQGDVVVPLEKGYADNAETDLGWSFDASGDNASGGSWQRYAPSSGSSIQHPDGHTIYLAPETDIGPGNEMQAFATAVGGYNVDFGSTTLTTPSFDLSAYQDPYLSFDLWYTNDAFFWLPKDDRLSMLISNDDGENWVILDELDVTSEGWEPREIRVGSLLEPTDRMLFRVIAADLNEQQWVFAAIDEFRITEGPSTSVDAPSAGEAISSSALALFPNPITDDGVLEVYLKEDRSAVRIDLLDELGRHVEELYRGELSEGRTRLPLKSTSLSPGLYIVRFIADDGSVRYLPARVVR